MQDSLPPWIEKIVDRGIQMLQNETFKKKIQIMVLEPFLQNMIELIFPYVIILCVVFGIMILLLVSTLGILVFKLTGAASPSVIGVSV